MLGPVSFAFRSLVLAALLAIVSVASASPPTSTTDAPSQPAARPSADTAFPSEDTASRSEPLDVLDEVARDPIWLALLHQARHSIGGATREAFLEAGFFFDPDGANRPRLELIATRAALLDPDSSAAQRARCRFPARYQFLVERGLLPDAPRGDCPELDAWRAQIGAFELTLVFPDAFLGNPASMFGHTLLRFDPLDRSGALRDESLLGWTLDYTANAQGDQGATYLLRGLTGHYDGKFGISPYYEKTKLYSDWQDRDIWEYPLSMPERDRERVPLHVWEVQDLLLPYYFFTQNCSEKLLELRTRLVTKQRGRGLDTAPIFRAQAGPGVAFAPAAGLHLYSFAELVLEAAPAIEGNAAAGPLARAGLSWSSKQGGYTIRLEGLAGALLGRDSSEWLGAKLEQRVSLGRQWSAVLGGHFDRAYDVGHFEGRLGLIRYF